MRTSTFALALLSGSAYGYPGMRKLMVDLMKRQVPSNVPEPLIGDLATEGATTPVGLAVENCINGNGPCQDQTIKTYTPPGALGTSACISDTCCVWDYLVNDLVELFTACDGTCTTAARSAIRFAFHDAASWDLQASFGGADGSLFLSGDEINRSENNGLQAWRQRGLQLLQKYGVFGVGAADLAQFAHNVAVVVCPLGPRTLTYVGRTSSPTSNLPNLLPDVNSSADTLIDLFSQKSISYVDLIALIGAHSAAQQFTVDPSRAGQPLDSTPGIWDVKFYQEMLAGAPPPGVFRLPSDEVLSEDSEAHPAFVSFASSQGQTIWNSLYAKAFLRVSMLGVNNINELTDCTHVLPTRISAFNATTNGVCAAASSSASVPPSSASFSSVPSSGPFSANSHPSNSASKPSSANTTGFPSQLRSRTPLSETVPLAIPGLPGLPFLDPQADQNSSPSSSSSLPQALPSSPPPPPPPPAAAAQSAASSQSLSMMSDSPSPTPSSPPSPSTLSSSSSTPSSTTTTGNSSPLGGLTDMLNPVLGLLQNLR